MARADDLAGVTPEARVPGSLECADHAEIGRVPRQGDDATAHAPGRAGDDQLDHGPVDPGSGLQDAGLDQRLAELLPVRRDHRHMGRRHSARIIPSMAIASFTGMGLVSMNIALQTG